MHAFSPRLTWAGICVLTRYADLNFIILIINQNYLLSFVRKITNSLLYSVHGNTTSLTDTLILYWHHLPMPLHHLWSDLVICAQNSFIKTLGDFSGLSWRDLQFIIKILFSRGVYSSIIHLKRWGIIFPLWGRIPSFWG